MKYRRSRRSDSEKDARGAEADPADVSVNVFSPVVRDDCASLVLARLMCVGMIKVRIIGAHPSSSLFCEFADGLIDGKSRENASLKSWQCLLKFVLNFVSELQFRIMHLALKPAHCFSVFLICICTLGFVSSLSGRMFFCAPLTNRKRMPFCWPMNL